MTVIEVAPGGGWYTEILAPSLYPHGHLIEAAPSSVKFTANLKVDPAVYGHIGKIVPFARPMQTLSEATQRLPDDFKQPYPAIPWQQISDFRNILVHNYLA